MASDLKNSIINAQIIPPHTHPLSLDSGNSVKAFLKAAAKDFGKTTIAITDHGTIGAVLECIDYAKELKKKDNLNLTVIPGVELYLLPDADDDSGFSYYHLTVHFNDFNAYLDFCKLSKAAFDRSIWKGGELKPLTTWDELRSVSGKVTLFSGCLLSPCNRPILNGRKDIAERNFKRIMEIAGKDRFYVEIFPYEVSKNWNSKSQSFELIPGTDCCPSGKLQIEANQWMHYMATKYNAPMVLSEDAHYAHEKDKIIQDLRLGQNGKSTWKMSDANCLHTNEWLYEEMRRLHPEFMDAKTFLQMAENSIKFSENFKGFEQQAKPRLPAVEVTLKPGLSYDDALIEATMRLVREGGRVDVKDPVYADRLIHEIKQLALNGKVNILPYFLFLQKIVKWCSENEVLVGPGRGSAAGSLLAYSLGITSVNPIKCELSFERFFDISRVEEGLADIDMDFSDRNKVVDWLKQEYGDKFAYLGTAGTFKTKSLLKDFDRFLYGAVRPQTEAVCKTIPTSPQGASEEEFLNGYTDADGNYHEGHLETNQLLQEYFANNSDVEKYFSTAIGMVRQMGRHAAGILIANEPIQNFIPVMKVSDEPTTQLMPKWVEKAGGVKYDILGVSTLEDIRLCMKSVLARYGKTLDPWTLPDMPEVWESMANEPATIFQLHTKTVRPGLQSMRPKSINEGAILTSVFRPGAMDAPSDEYPGMNMADVFIKRWTGEFPVTMTHSDLQDILGETKGAIVYQESIMKIAHELGGLTMPETQKLRKAISKKTGDELMKLLQTVKAGLIARNWTEQQATTVTDQMKASGKYAFNKSHAVSYIYIAYACGYLKHYYPIEWWSAVLTNASKDDLKIYWQNMADHILPPDINYSTNEFQIIKKNGVDKIVAPLNLIEGVGEAALNAITTSRPFSDLDDMIIKTAGTKLNRGVMFKLIFSGILDPFMPKEALFESDKINYYLERKSILTETKREATPVQLIGMTNIQRSLLKKTIFKVHNEDLKEASLPALIERKMVSPIQPGSQTYLYHDLKDKYKPQKVLIGVKYLEEILEGESGADFAMIGYVVKTKDHKYGPSKSKTMLKVQVDIEDKNYDFVMFPAWKKDHHGVEVDLEESICVIVMNKREGQPECFIRDIYPIETTEFLKEKKEVKIKKEKKRKET